VNTPEDGTRTDVVRMVTRRLIPLVGACHLIASLDRQNVSYPKLQMVGDLGLSEYASGLGARCSSSATSCSRCPAASSWSGRAPTAGSLAL
jgi:hypothetical protein